MILSALVVQVPNLSLAYKLAHRNIDMRAKKPTDNRVIALISGEIRTQVKLPVLHKPDPKKQSHSEVTLPENGEDLTEARIKLGRIATIVIPLGD